VDADGDGKAAMVGIAAHLRVFDPLRRYHPGDILLARTCDQVFNQVYFHACMKGEAQITWAGVVLATIRASWLRGTMDYIGLNYYSRDVIKFSPGSPMMAERLVMPGAPVSELNWEIYPEGIYRLIMQLKRHNKPIYITENGLADTAGTKRGAFIRDHLAWIGKAIQEGADVRGYYHWSLMDNFEWAEGFWPRFGLYTVDYANDLTRTLTEGGKVFAGIAGANKLSVDDPDAPPAR
jgi:beta-glucosidase